MQDDLRQHPDAACVSIAGSYRRRKEIVRDLDFIVTTEKDSVRFPYAMENLDVPIYYLRVEIEILNGHDCWEDLVARLCERRAVKKVERYFA